MKPEPNRTPEGESLVPLIERAKAGDQRAYTALYEATEREVYRTVRAMIRSEELARDVQQEVYIYAFTHLDSLREPEKLRAWLRSIAVNQSHMALRQVSPVLFSELDNGEGAELPELADLSGDTEPELTLERKETARYVSEILDDLTDGQRAVVAMYYYEQLPVSEIARDLGVTPGTVKTQLFRSRKKIETAVRRLEDRGVKLLGLAPLPFLVALLKRLPPAAEGSKAALQGALARSGLTPAAQAAGTVTAGTASTAGTAASVAGTAAADAAASFAETAAVQVGRRFFETALGKVVLGLITAAAIGGGIAGFKWYQNRVNLGDVRPPETLEINLRYDTDEDLTTEPTAETDTEPVTTAAPETNEDLVPETDEDLPPEPTDPVETTDPVGGADPSGPDPTAPTEPTDPDPTAPVIGSQNPTSSEATSDPSVPDAPLDPVGEAPDPFSQPTETAHTEPVTLNPRIVSCSWGELDDLYDQPWGSVNYLEVVTEDGAVPTVYTDNETVVSLRSEGYILSASNDRQRIYHWEVTFLGPGTARVYCVYNGEAAKVFSVTNPDHPDEILSVQVNETVDPTELSLSKGQVAWLYVAVQGKRLPQISSDHPEILGIQNQQTLHDGNSAWYRTLYGWLLQPNAAGIANITITFNGKIGHTIRVTIDQ